MIKNIVIVGGGENNKFLVKKIKETLKDISIYTGKEVGIPSNFIEAELIAFLSMRKFYNLPSSFSTTTGVTKDTILGNYNYIIESGKDL